MRAKLEPAFAFLLVLAILFLPVRKYLRQFDLAWVHLFLFAFLLSISLTPLTAWFARRWGIMDKPGGRKIHKVPTPLLGGLAVYAAYAVVVVHNFHFSLELKGVAAGGTLILLLGLVDDIKPVPAAAKLLVQLVACGIMMATGVMLSLLPNTGWGKVGEVLLTLIWVVGITNAVNFLDGLDGLVAGLAAVACLTFFVIAGETGQLYLGLLAIALAGSCLGFLRHNFHPARIFLGDAGSTFLGFSLAGLAVMGGWAEKNPLVALSLPVIVLGLPIFDVVYITVARIYSGEVRNFREWIEYVGRDHFHHRLLFLGLTQRQAAVFIYLICISLGLGAVVLRRAGTTTDALLLVIQGAIVLLLLAVLMIAGRRLVGKE